MRDAQDADKVALLYKVWRQRLSYRVVRTAEESKIALSNRAEHAVSLPFISDDLATAISQEGLETALAQPLQRILEQVQLALENGKEAGRHLPHRRKRPFTADQKRWRNSCRVFRLPVAMTLAPLPRGWRAGRR